MDTQTIFVERKTHREDWTGEKSVKARFPLKEKNVNAFMRGEYTVEQAFEKMRKEGKKSIKEIESLEALAREVQYSVITRRLEPAVRSFYNRTAFQLPGDARVRISLDTELSMIREDNWDGRKRSGDNWRRMDIGIDYPFSQLPPNDIERFPYAILEVKLQTQAGQEPPAWVRELTSSHLVEAVPKFSKFIHGTATLFPHDIKLLPFWLPQMGVDIRKPATHKFGIERPNQSALASTSDEPSSTSDEDTDSEDRPTHRPAQTNGHHHTDQHHEITNSSGGGSNFLDPEERTGQPIPLSASDYYDSELEDDSSTTSLLPHRRHHLPTPLQRAISFVLYLLAKLSPHPRSTQVTGHNPHAQTIYSRPFRAPPGKKIHVPIRIEPKVHFAAERTFLSWFEFGVILSAVATTLVEFGGGEGAMLWAGLGFTVVAVAALAYAAGLYLWRVKAMRERRAVRFHDKWGANVLCGLMVVAVGVNFWGALTGREDEIPIRG